MTTDTPAQSVGCRVMTFTPSKEEFKDFGRCIAYMESQGAHRAGMAKIIPPKGWKPRRTYDDIDDLVIPAPIQQVVTGQSGLFTQYNIQKKPMTVHEFRKTSNMDKFCSPRYVDFEELERKFWKNLTFNPPLYGADVSGTLYDPDVTEWNIGHLNTILDIVENESGIKIKGVNTPYLYFGMWKSAFAWHTEDMDLYSINYLHFGEPKSWYVVPPEHGKRLERLAKGFFPGNVQGCEAFLRHKMTLISPLILKKYGIPFEKVTQEAGQFIVTFPFGYHAGFNHGFNCAESTNFATQRWIDYGKQATLCSCRQDMVKISMDVFVRKFQPERYKLWKAGKDNAPIDHSKPTPEAAEFLKDDKKTRPSKASPCEVSSEEPDTPVQEGESPQPQTGTKRQLEADKSSEDIKPELPVKEMEPKEVEPKKAKLARKECPAKVANKSEKDTVRGKPEPKKEKGTKPQSKPQLKANPKKTSNRRSPLKKEKNCIVDVSPPEPAENQVVAPSAEETGGSEEPPLGSSCSPAHKVFQRTLSPADVLHVHSYAKGDYGEGEVLPKEEKKSEDSDHETEKDNSYVGKAQVAEVVEGDGKLRTDLGQLPGHHPLIKDGMSDEETPEEPPPVEEGGLEGENWAKPLAHLWQSRPPILKKEREYNQRMGSKPPYCSICLLFHTYQQTECANSIDSHVMVVGGRMRTKPLIPEMCFTTTTEEDAECEEQPETPHLEEDGTSVLISCSQCSVRVHAYNFTDAAVSGRINGEHKEKDLEPWDGGETHNSDSFESLDTDVSNGWDPNDMFKYNEEKYGVLSTYDSSLSTYTVPLERDNSEEFLKREARAAQLAEEIEASATYKARVALENDERTDEEKYTAVVRGERETHTLGRENKYIPPGQRNREAMSWGPGRQNSPRLGQSSAGPPTPRPGPHDYSPSSGADQRVVNGGSSHWPSPCPSPSSRPPSRYQSGPSSLPHRAPTPTRPPSRPPSRPSRPSSHSSHLSYPSSSSCFSHHGPTSPASTLAKRMSSEGPPRMSPKSQRTPRAHRVPPCRTSGVSPGVDLISHNAPGEGSVTPSTRSSSSSGGTWSSVVSGAHRPRSPRQNSMGGASPGSSSSLPSPQTGTAPVETVNTPTSASSPTAASPAPNIVTSPSGDAKECRAQETRQTSPTNKENIKPLESSPNFTRQVCKGPPSIPSDHRKQIDNLKKFSVDFRLQSSSNPEPPCETVMTKPARDSADKPKDLPLDKSSTVGREGTEDSVVVIAAGATSGTPAPSTTTTNTSKADSPAAMCPSTSSPDQKRTGLDVTSQGVQTTATSTFSGPKQEEKEEKKEAVQDQVRKSTLNPNANEFKPRFNSQPKPANTPTPPRPQGQPSPSIVVQQPPTVYSQTVCFPQMYPLTPVSPGVQSPAMYQVQMPHMTVSQSKPYRPGKVPNMPQQRSDQHHPPGTPTMMHPATAAGPPIVAPSPAYSAQYFTCSPQQFTSQPLVQQMPHYQSQAQHVFSPVMQGSARMMAPPTHGQPGLVSSSTTQYPEQTHTMYVSPGPMPQQYPHPSATLHPHPQHPQPSATPTGQAQQGGPPQHGGPPSHPAASPVQHPQHPQAAAAAAAAQALHLANQNPQQQMYSALAPTPPSMTPGPNPQSPQASFPSAQQAVYIHPQQVQHGYNPNHMAHVQQAHIQSGIVPSHHPAPTHPPMMLMATQGPPAGPQPPMPQTALNPIPVSSTTHFSYLAHPQVQPHHQQQL